MKDKKLKKCEKKGKCKEQKKVCKLEKKLGKLQCEQQYVAELIGQLQLVADEIREEIQTITDKLAQKAEKASEEEAAKEAAPEEAAPEAQTEEAAK